jgi:hypothetical protein
MSSEGVIRRRVTVVGGFYAETCHFPRTDVEFYGSGGRGAAAMPKAGIDVQLHTFSDQPNRNRLHALAEAAKFTVSAEEISSLYRFEYRHPLANPVYYHPKTAPPHPIKVEGDIVLCYGMMEGQPIVSANTAIFDPQSHNHAKPFSWNGSKAHRLAIIANNSEVKRLSNEPDLRLAAERLRRAESAEVVVVKCGPNGAIVATEDEISQVPAYRTDRVFKIGSGDVFSSIFTYAWAVQGLAPKDAAQIASLSTAYYCSKKSLPIKWPLPANFTPPETVLANSPRKAYLAGPFFTPNELWMIEEVRRLLLEFGIEVFSPLHEVGIGAPDIVAPADLKGILDSDFVFAILDNFDPGTVFEIGYAHAHKKPIIGVYHGEDDGNLTMLSGTGCQIHRDLASAIYSAASME